jgi:hypothetical protein
LYKSGLDELQEVKKQSLVVMEDRKSKLAKVKLEIVSLNPKEKLLDFLMQQKTKQEAKNLITHHLQSI